MSGVPQGSVLGPLLFLLFINDLPDSVKNKVKLFADDLKLIGNAAHSSSIIEDLKQLEEWENLWLLRFNPSKCKVIHLEFNDNPNIDYYLDGVNLNPSELEKDLGVSTHRSLLWNVHIKECISKANKMICWIARNLMIREKYVMLNIYKSLINNNNNKIWLFITHSTERNLRFFMHNCAYILCLYTGTGFFPLIFPLISVATHLLSSGTHVDERAKGA